MKETNIDLEPVAWTKLKRAINDSCYFCMSFAFCFPQTVADSKKVKNSATTTLRKRKREPMYFIQTVWSIYSCLNTHQATLLFRARISN